MSIRQSLRKFFGVRLGRYYQYPPRPLGDYDTATVLINDDDLPSISIVTPSFNQGRFITDTIESLLSQRYPKLEYIIQDNHSLDDTHAILQSAKINNDGERIKVFIENDTGQSDALNRGFAKSSGEIMGYLNSDDLLLPGSLAMVGAYFRDNPNVDAIYGNRVIINELGMEVGQWILPRHDAEIISHIDYVPQETLFWRRRIWNQVGAFNNDLRFALDWDLILRFIEVGANIHHLPSLFGAFRAHQGQKSQKNYNFEGKREISMLRSRSRKSLVQRIRLNILHMKYLIDHISVADEFKAGH
jgi:glycosyltransferase involved in cell wall biosynthesis